MTTLFSPKNIIHKPIVVKNINHLKNQIFLKEKSCNFCQLLVVVSVNLDEEKNSEWEYINISPHTHFGGWGFFCFTSSDVHIQTFRRSQVRNETENWKLHGIWKNYIAFLWWIFPVLIVFKIKIRDIENQKHIITFLLVFDCFKLYTI